MAEEAQAEGDETASPGCPSTGLSPSRATANLVLSHHAMWATSMIGL